MKFYQQSFNSFNTVSWGDVVAMDTLPETNIASEKKMVVIAVSFGMACFQVLC